MEAMLSSVNLFLGDICCPGGDSGDSYGGNAQFCKPVCRGHLLPWPLMGTVVTHMVAMLSAVKLFVGDICCPGGDCGDLPGGLADCSDRRFDVTTTLRLQHNCSTECNCNDPCICVSQCNQLNVNINQHTCCCNKRNNSLKTWLLKK